MKNKLYMFDLDGTLCDTNMVNYLSYKRALNDEGFDMTFDYYATKCNGRNYKDFIPPISRGDAKFLQRIHKSKKQNYLSNLQYAVVNKELLQFIGDNKENAYIALCTTASKQNCMNLLEHLNIVDLFDAIITGEDVKHAKPDPECYLMLVERFGVKKEDCLIFEDSERGILSAKNAGIECVVINMPPNYNGDL